MTIEEARETLKQRRDWLTERMAGKEKFGWDVQWDTKERDALTLILEQTEGMIGLRHT